MNHGGRKTSFSEVKNGPDQSASISLDSPSTTFSLPNAPALQQGMLFQDFGHGKQKFVGLDSLNLEEKVFICATYYFIAHLAQSTAAAMLYGISTTPE